MRFLLAVFLSAPLLVQAQETEASDILFLKIQELEEEIAISESCSAVGIS